MTFALATATLLSLIWLGVVSASALIERKGARIFSALKGELQPERVVTAPVRLRHRTRSDEVLRARPRLSAAA